MNLKSLYSLLFIFSVLFFNPIQAQISDGGTPIGLSLSNDLKADIPSVTMPPLNMKAIIAEDAEDEANNVPPRFGFPHKVSYSLSNSGKWTEIADGSRLWQLKIEAPEALSINLNYSSFYMPNGAKLFIYDETGTQVLGAFTERNNKPHQTFSSGILKTSSCIVEYYEPADQINEGKLTISTIVQGYRYIGGASTLKAFGSSGPCNNDVNCSVGDAWADEIDGVAMILLANGTRWCSGSLINNTALDCKPYFLTANHCLTNDVANWVFMFNYESPTCSGADGPTNQTVQGSTLLASAGNSDFALLELDDNPQDFYNVYFNGWDRGNTPFASSCGIHHPAGDVKKISFEDDIMSSTTYSSNTTNGTATHWRVADWDDGTTEGGSSGSPLFDQASRRIVGQLHGGGAACNGNSNNGQPDWYGKIWYSWDQNGTAANNSLASWLDPIGSGVMGLDGDLNPCAPTVPDNAGITSISNPNGTICTAITSVDPEINIRNYGTNNLTSLTITYDIDGGTAQTFSWTGNLATGASEMVTLPTIALPAGMHALNVTVSNPNGVTDNDLNNNDLTTAYNLISASIQCYCTAAGSTTQDEWIESVVLGSFTNNSGDNSGYQDFTNLTANFDPGNSYPVTLTPGFTGTLYQEYWRVWIDFNQDGAFDDATETVFDSGTTSDATVTGTMNIPAGAMTGTTFMRVSMSYNESSTSCESFTYGEVEDYTVIIGSSCADADNDSVCDPDDVCPGGNDTVDLNGNSIPDDCEPVEVALKVFLEGPYNPATGTMQTLLSVYNLIPLNQPFNNAIYNHTGSEALSTVSNNIVDWVLVEARTGPNSSDKIETKAGILLSNGEIKSVDGISNLTFNLPPNNDVYLLIRQRNHLDIMTATPQSRSLLITYDFTTAITQAYGPAQQKTMSDGTPAMYAGEISQDHTIQNTDYNFWINNAAQLGVYTPEDANMDGSVQVTDYDLWFINKAKTSPAEINY